MLRKNKTVSEKKSVERENESLPMEMSMSSSIWLTSYLNVTHLHLYAFTWITMILSSQCESHNVRSKHKGRGICASHPPLGVLQCTCTQCNRLSSIHCMSAQGQTDESIQETQALSVLGLAGSCLLGCCLPCRVVVTWWIVGKLLSEGAIAQAVN